MKNNILTGLTMFATLMLLLLVTDPFMLFMPAQIGLLTLILLTLFVCVWGTYILSHKTEDEREVRNRMNAGLVGYLSGILILMIAILFETYVQHHIDPWLALAAATMIGMQFIAAMYSTNHS